MTIADFVRGAAGVLALFLTVQAGDLKEALDKQDRAALEQEIESRKANASAKANDSQAQYQLALAYSYLAEVGTETGAKDEARKAAESGIPVARKAVELAPRNAENHRVLGTLCGQAIPGNVMSALKYGGCARDSIDKAIELAPKTAIHYVSRGVGNYYMPQAFGGGVEKAIQDFQKALELDPKLAEAELWLGIALRKANRPAEARAAIERSLKLNPNRQWARQQLAKTPAKE